MDNMSMTPWSNFKESDYTPEQWKKACLIVRGDGSTKAQCSLPVREPDGTVNHFALIAAAGALAGARGGVNAMDQEKAKARATLRGLYTKGGMPMPASLMHFETPKLDAFLSHFGIKGQKWGVRRSDAQISGTASSGDSADAIRARNTLAAIKAKGSLSAVSDSDLNHLINRINTEKRYADVNPSSFEKGHNAIKTTLSVGKTMNEAIKFYNSKAGRLIADSLNLTTHGSHSREGGKHLASFVAKQK